MASSPGTRGITAAVLIVFIKISKVLASLAFSSSWCLNRHGNDIVSLYRFLVKERETDGSSLERMFAANPGIQR